MFEKNGVFVNGDTIAVNRKEDKYMAEAEQMYKNENMPFASRNGKSRRSGNPLHNSTL